MREYTKEEKEDLKRRIIAARTVKPVDNTGNKEIEAAIDEVIEEADWEYRMGLRRGR